jgi:hypothetical protein
VLVNGDQATRDVTKAGIAEARMPGPGMPGPGMPGPVTAEDNRPQEEEAGRCTLESAISCGRMSVHTHMHTNKHT